MATKLTALKVKHAKPGKRYGDGNGLFLDMRDGPGRWVLIKQVRRKRHEFGLGSLTDVDLADARTQAEDLRRWLRKLPPGVDPVRARRKEKEAVPNFKKVATDVHTAHKKTWDNDRHAGEWLSSLERHIFPTLGEVAVDEIDRTLLLDALMPIWLRLPDTARRIRQRIGVILDYAYAKGWREMEAPMRSLSKGLPKQPKKNQKHFAALPWQDVPSFFATMADKLTSGEVALDAIRFVILTAGRSGEVRGATWAEIDLAAKTWTVPERRMKSGVEHVVPLSEAAVEILNRRAEARRDDNPGTLVFPGTKPGRPLNEITLCVALRRAGVPATIHGFRSSFRDWAAEMTNVPREIAEAALAHSVKDKTEGAYLRTAYFDKRRLLMDRWASYVTGKSGAVVQIQRAINE